MNKVTVKVDDFLSVVLSNNIISLYYDLNVNNIYRNFIDWCTSGRVDGFQ